MNYGSVTIGTVVARVSRFTVTVTVNGEVVAAHLSNTGRNKELLVPGHPVSIRRAANSARKTPYDILAVQRDGRWINIDSLAPNRVVNAALQAGTLALPGCPGPYTVHPETTYLDSRLDFAGTAADGGQWFAETKGVTLANGPHAAFPDAPTTRGLKHVHTLTHAVAAGYRAYLLLVVQLPGIETVTIYKDRFPALAPAITAAKAAGVRVIALTCQTGPDFITLDRAVAFDETLPFTEV
ncbi:DNA/RNA nuclease SfsA [Lacticaseibacillus absianus]|uniref:DNA/RNA nuclease SfsA n=1 Tax=Lacticaseibacillus absianus TaxID=2729623 RepID=UPI0015CA0DF6|nr:DNA/RNA nuclease SfsA [Lacticaseibacillus absianus]